MPILLGQLQNPEVRFTLSSSNQELSSFSYHGATVESILQTVNQNLLQTQSVSKLPHGHHEVHAHRKEQELGQQS